MEKIIHYCWFGKNDLPEIAKKCIESWKKYLPDYKIICWNEDNFDVNQNIFIKQAYENKKWAFVSDYARLKVLSEYGGIYLDTDMEITRDILDIIESSECFLGVEDSGLVNAAIIGVRKPHNVFIDSLISQYDNLEGFNNNDIYALTIPRQVTNMLETLGFDKEKKEIQSFYNGELLVYPRDYFYPLSYDYHDNLFTENTCCIHHFNATWASKTEKISLFCRRHNMKFTLKIFDFAINIKNIFCGIFKDKAFWLFFGVTILFLGAFIKLQYATDTYTIFNQNYIIPLKHFLLSGRFLTAGFWYIISILNLGIYKSYIISFGLGIIFVSLSIYKLYRIFIKDISNKFLCGILAIAIVINPFLIELFLFFEKGILSFSILMSILGVDFFIKFLNKKTIKRFIVSMFFMLLAIFSYQGTISIFMGLGAIYIVKYSKNIKQFIKNNIFLGLIYGIPAIINYLVVNFFFNNSRVTTGIYIIEESLRKIFVGLKELYIRSFDILPKYFFLSIIIISIIIFIISIIIDKSKGSYKLLSILKLIYIIIMLNIFTILPQLIIKTDSIWMVARSSYAIASIIGIIIIHLLYEVKCNKIINNFIILILIFYLGIQYVSYQKIIKDHYILNYLDNYICTQIKDEILEYELNTGINIKNIVFYRDKSPSYSYQNIICYGDMNIRAFYPEWSVGSIINEKLNKQLIEIKDKDIEIEKFFCDNNWDYYSKEQIIFKGDTIHLCVF